MEKQILEFPGYFATEDGRVISYRQSIKRELRGSYDVGYRGVLLRRNGNTFRRNVHRLVAATFLDNPDGLPEVNHIDGDKANNSADNLEWCTHSTNMRHSVSTGLWTPPTSEHYARLRVAAGKARALFTETDARNIRAIYLYMDKPSSRRLAKAYNCSKAVIQRLVNGKQAVFKDSK